jgi:hypothetical protein
MVILRVFNIKFLAAYQQVPYLSGIVYIDGTDIYQGIKRERQAQENR